MQNKTIESLNAFADELLLFGTAHKKDFISEILKFDAEADLDTTNSKTLTKYIVALGQYTITLTSNYNASAVYYSLLNREFKRKVKVKAMSYVGTGSKGPTGEERENKAISESPELEELELRVEEAKAKVDMLEGIEKAVTELINGFKAELNRRYKEA